jgi:hypothetical protein
MASAVLFFNNLNWLVTLFSSKSNKSIKDKLEAIASVILGW